MREMRLKKMIIISLKEKAAKTIDFHPKTTIITGANRAGKSSIIKSIYQTFGAKINETSNWNEVEAFTYIEFTVNKENYLILYSGNPRWFFIKSIDFPKKIHYFTSITNELAPFLCDLFDFKLEITDKNMKRGKALPAILFSPFYIDQDDGWTGTFKSFQGISWFKDWKIDLLDYYVGKKPPEYFPIKTKKINLEVNYKKKETEYNIKKDHLSEFIEEFSDNIQDIDIEVDFEKEIAFFENNINNLNEERRVAKNRVFKIRNRVRVIEEQINIAKQLNKDLKLDYDFAVNSTKLDHIECPTCGAEYKNELINRFTLINDHEKSLEILKTLVSEKEELKSEESSLSSSISSIDKKLSEIRKFLNVTRKKISFKEYIEIKARDKVTEKYTNNISAFEEELKVDNEEIEDKKKDLKKLINKKVSKSIMDNYKKYLQSAFIELDVQNVKEKVYKLINANIDFSGSNRSRAILAYYYTILKLVDENTNTSILPLLIDTPKQQDPDDENIAKIFKFISSNFSFIPQLILGSVQVPDINNFGEHKNYNLTNEKDHVLDKEEFSEASRIIEPLLKEALSFDKLSDIEHLAKE